VELLVRVDALARRSATVVKETVLRVGDLTLNLVSRTVSRGGRDIELLPREFQVLEYLVRNEGHVVPRAMLFQHVWDLLLTPQPTSSTSMSDGSAARSKASRPIPSSILSEGSGFASVLLAKTLRSSKPPPTCAADRIITAANTGSQPNLAISALRRFHAEHVRTLIPDRPTCSDCGNLCNDMVPLS
jgi:hypothetical protein